MRVPEPAPVPGPAPDPTRRLAALAIAAALVLPAGLLEQGPVLCPVRRATGLPCPACGLTRSWSAALRLRPVASLRFHPLGMVALAGAAAYAAGLDARADPAVLRRARAMAPVLVAAWLGTWAVRVGRAASPRSRAPA